MSKKSGRTVEVREGVFVEMCPKKGCVLAASHPKGKHRSYRVSMLACPHNVPNFGPSCPICD
jgi:hypothetical protein